jgi:hypothetical protein
MVACPFLKKKANPGEGMSEQQQEPSTIELFTADQAGQGKSNRGRLYFKHYGDRFVPVKGEHVPAESEGGQVRARLFTYSVEGPPFTADPRDPKSITHPRTGTYYKTRAINAIHALDNVILERRDPRHPGGRFSVVWDLVPEGAVEYGFAQNLVGAYAAYDELLGAAKDYSDWRARHNAWLGKPQFYDDAEIAADGETRLKLPKASREHVGALSKHHAAANLDVVLSIRAQRSEHWVKLRPTADDLERERVAFEGPEAAAEVEHEAMIEGLGAKFTEFLDTLSDEERKYVKVLDADAFGPPPAPPLGGWVELQPGTGFPVPGQGMTQELADFAKAFPQIELPPGAFSMPPGPGMGMPGLGVPFAPMGGMPQPKPSVLGGFIPGPEAFGGSSFAPGADESFTLDDAASHQRKLEEANGYADALGAHLRAGANERSRKLKAFKDVVAGGLHWLLEKVEGAPAPIPPEPVVPSPARTHVNGGRPAVIQAFEQLGAFRDRPPNVVTPADLVAGESAFRVGAPGEEF